MPQIRILTWNTQGSPLNSQTKAQALDGFLANADVVCLQECGSLADLTQYQGAGKTWRVYGRQAAGAGNRRCSTAILAPGWHNAGDAADMSTGRAGVWIQMNNLFVSTIHCTADGKSFDSSQLMKQMTSIAGGSNPIIIGGDFNCVPTGDTRNVGTSSRQKLFNIYRQGQPTHPRSNKELDYFLGMNLKSGQVTRGPQGGSDHHAVGAVFEF